MCSLSKIYKASISVFLLFIVSATRAQDTVAVKESVVVNKSMKMVFDGLKNNNDNSTRTTFLIITVVLVIVGIAMYMSFKDPDKAKN